MFCVWVQLFAVALAASVAFILAVFGALILAVAEAVTSSADNCAVVSVVLDKTLFVCSEANTTITVTATVTDQSGNSIDDTVEVTVLDSEAPTVTAVASHTVTLDGTGSGAATAATLTASSGDNCGVVVTASQESFNCSDLGGNTVTLTATDPSGNTALTGATMMFEILCVVADALAKRRST